MVVAEHSRWRGSRRRLRSMIDAEIDREAISRSPVHFYATCLAGFPIGSPTYFRLNDRQPAAIDDILCASAAVPFLFNPVEIDGVPYSDGGVGLGRDNVPIRPIYDEGCETIIVVHLSPRQVLNPKAFPQSRLIPIVPSAGCCRAIGMA